MQRTCKLHFFMQNSCKKTCAVHVQYMQSICKVHAKYMQKNVHSTCKVHARCLQSTCQLLMYDVACFKRANSSQCCQLNTRSCRQPVSAQTSKFLNEVLQWLRSGSERKMHFVKTHLTKNGNSKNAFCEDFSLKFLWIPHCGSGPVGNTRRKSSRFFGPGRRESPLWVRAILLAIVSS